MAIAIGANPVAALRIGSNVVVRAFLGSTEVWSLSSGEGRVVLVHRYSSLQSYDQALITRLEGFGYSVGTVYQSNVDTYDFTDAGLVIIGAPSTGYTTVSHGSILSNLNAHVIVMCRSTARNVFSMASGSGGVNTSQYTVKDVSHSVQLPGYSVGQTVSMGSYIHNQGISSIRAGFTELAASNSSYAGIVAKDEGDFRRIFWGYYRFDTLSDEGAHLFGEILRTEYPLQAPTIAAVRWMGHVSALPPEAKLPLIVPNILRVQPAFTTALRTVRPPRIIRVDPAFGGGDKDIRGPLIIRVDPSFKEKT